MRKCEVSVEGLKVLRAAAKDYRDGTDYRTWRTPQRDDLTEALKEADARLSAADTKDAPEKEHGDYTEAE